MVVLMVDALLNVKFLLVREHQMAQHAIFHEVQKVSTSFDPHSFMRGCELMALLHLVGKDLEVLLKDAAHRSLADSSLCGQFGRWTTEICPQLFTRVFNHSLGSNCSLSGPVDWMSCLSPWNSDSEASVKLLKDTFEVNSVLAFTYDLWSRK